VVGAEQAAPAAGHQQIAEDPMAYVLVVLGGDGGLPPDRSSAPRTSTAYDPGQALRGGQVGGDNRQVGQAL
jgi:hypothetical protein